MKTLFPYSIECRVRGYEIDQFGHVNNAVYLNWLEHARWEMGAAGDFNFFSDILPVVRYVELDYRAETRMGDTLRITIWPRKLGTTSFSYGNSIRIIAATHRPEHRVNTLAMTAHTVFACVARDGTGKVPVPAHWRPYFPAEDPGEALPKGA